MVETSATIAADGSCSFTGPLEPPAGSLLRVQLSNNSSEVGGLVGWSVAFDNPGTGVMALPGLTNTLYLKLDAVAAPFEILCGVESQSGWPARRPSDRYCTAWRNRSTISREVPIPGASSMWPTSRR